MDNGHTPAANGTTQPRRLTRDIARQRKAARLDAEAFDFPLRFSAAPGTEPEVARVRLPGMTERGVLDKLPRAVQQMIAAKLAMGEAGGTTNLTPEDFLAILLNYPQMADDFCLAGFLDPWLVREESEVDENDPRCIWIDDIDPRDREAFLTLCLNNDKEAASQAAPFRHGPLDPLPVEPGEQAEPAAIGVAGDGGPLF